MFVASQAVNLEHELIHVWHLVKDFAVRFSCAPGRLLWPRCAVFLDGSSATSQSQGSLSFCTCDAHRRMGLDIDRKELSLVRQFPALVSPFVSQAKPAWWIPFWDVIDEHRPVFRSGHALNQCSLPCHLGQQESLIHHSDPGLQFVFIRCSDGSF